MSDIAVQCVAHAVDAVIPLILNNVKDVTCPLIHLVAVERKLLSCMPAARVYNDRLKRPQISDPVFN